MQTIKKVILVLICLVVLLTSFVYPAAAVEYYYDDFGDVWLQDDIEYFFYKEPYMEMALPSVLIAIEPNFSSYDPNQIPWIEAPSYVQDIIHSEMPIMTVDEYIKVPFACAIRVGSLIRVFVGWNLCLGRVYSHNVSTNTTTRSGIGLFMFSNLGSSKYSVCYSADFNADYTIRVPWRAVDPIEVGSTGYVKQFSGLSIAANAYADIYCYGANYGKEGNVTSFQVLSTPNTQDGTKINYNSVNVVQNPRSGFSSGRFVPYQDDFSNSYFASFTPKSIEQIEQETQKGIWESIKELPSKITEGIKNLLDKMLNYILYFQDTKPEHVNPFADILTDVKTFFNDQLSDVGDFKNSLSSTLNNVVTYIDTGSGVVNTFLTAVPMLSAFITFFVVFCIVRKVIGR